jgi:class 3 adenylate cyclase/tetratricopeptide (TPR) repeat protein
MAAGRSGPDTLARFVPRVSAEWDLDAPGSLVRVTDASLVFVDISGFTNLSERLARKGRIGAEELTDVLNRVFGAMLDLAYERGGALLKFGGDALLLMFEGDDHPLQAASAAVEMRAALRDAATIPTSVGRVPLRMSVGVHSGDVHLFRVGSLHQELVVTGPGASRTTQMEAAAAAGEIFVSPETAARLPRGAATPSAADDGHAGWRLKWRRAPVAGPGLVPRREVSADAVAGCLPAVLRAHLADGLSEFEHRVASVAFVKFKGVDALMANEGADAVAKGLSEIVRVTQEAAESEGVAFLASDIDEDGGKLILVSGVPANQADDEGRLLRAARRIADHEGVLYKKIGVNRGHVFAGTVGAEYRATYTVMGDTVNLAARLMAAAPPGAVYATAPVLERSRTRFDVEVVPPFMVKGKSAPVHAFAVGAEAGHRAAAGDDDQGPFVGRTAELDVLVDALRRADSEAARPVEVVGESGLGKSRLVREAIAAAAVSTFMVRGEPTGTNSPYRAFREPLRALLGIERGEQAAMAATLRASVVAVDADLAEYVPLIAAVASIDVDSTPTVDAIDARFRPGRTADLLIRLLDALLPAPRAIVVEDAQWTDAVSDYLLERLVGAAQTHAWTVVSARRTGDAGWVPAEAAQVALGPLPDAAVRDLVVQTLDSVPLRPHEIDAIVARAAGSPLFADELIGVVRTTGSVDDMPDSLEAAVNAEIDRLEALPRALLRHAAVLGLRFRPSLLEAVLADSDIELDATALDGLGQYLERDGRDSAHFRQAVVREAAYAGLPYRRRRELHLRAGQTMEDLALSSGGVDREAASLSFHFAAGGDRERTWRYGRMAGSAAQRAYANADAAAQYRLALDAARRMDGLDAAEVADTWTALGDALEQAGVLDDALDAYRRASRCVGDDPVAKIAVLVKSARARERAGAYRAALRELTVAEQLLADVEGDAADRSRLRITTRRAIVRKSQERAHTALALALEAVAEAERLDEKAELCRAYLVVDWAYVVLGQAERAVHQPLVVELNEELGEIAQAGVALGNQGGVAYWLGRWDDALDCYRRAVEVCVRGGDVVLAALEQSNIGELLVSRGEYDEAAPVLAEALRTHRATGFIEGALFDEVQLGRLAAGRGDLEHAIEMLTATRDEAERLRMPSSVLEAAVHLGSALVTAGRPEEALAAVDSAAEAAGEEAQVFGAWVALVRGRALAALGRLDEALEAVTAGVDAAREMGIVYELGRLLVLRAGMGGRVGAGAPDEDRVEGEALLERLRVTAGR